MKSFVLLSYPTFMATYKITCSQSLCVSIKGGNKKQIVTSSIRLKIQLSKQWHYELLHWVFQPVVSWWSNERAQQINAFFLDSDNRGITIRKQKFGNHNHSNRMYKAVLLDSAQTVRFDKLIREPDT